jgi:dUTPase
MSYIDATEGPHTHAILYINIENAELFQEYKKAVQSHNINSLNDIYPNAGFDLFFPEIMTFNTVASTMASMGVKVEMKIYNEFDNKWHSTGYYMYPRSSISKTPLMLANGTGIIDSGYRGNLIGAFRNLSNEPYQVKKHTRLLQICSPDLRPIVVHMVDKSFFDETSRNDGGFGSTGL